MNCEAEELVSCNFFAEVASEDEARRVADELVKIVQGLGLTKIQEVKKYWKIPRYFLVSCDLMPQENSETCILELAERLGVGWEKVGDAYIWVPTEKNQFSCVEIRWASLEKIF